MKKLSRFDIIMIIAFVVVTLVGAGGAYYLEAFQLASAQSDVQAANDEFEKYSSKMVYLPIRENIKILKQNIDLIHAQIDPILKNNLQAPGNTLSEITSENSVDWKQKLDQSVDKLNAAAKLHGVQVPDGYYYTFAYFLSNAPAEENTAVLSKQLRAIETMVNILIGAPVNAIVKIRRTSENAGVKEDDALPGHSVEVDGGLYTDYPFEIQFDTTTGAFRKVINDLMQSPYVFVIRSVSVQNSQTVSPQLSVLDQIAGSQQSTAPVTDSPGATAAAQSTAGPQYLFGGELLHVRLRVDFIDWKGLPPDASSAGQKPAANPAAAKARGN